MPNTYTNNPSANHTLAQDQPNIQANFNYLANTLGTSNANNGDHQISVGGNDGSTFEGRHRQVCFNNRSGGAPDSSALADGVDSLLYSSNGNVFFNSSTGAGAFQLTRYNSGAGFGAATTGWTFLPGGLLLQYGQLTVANHAQIITFPVSFTNPPFNIQVTATYSAQSRGTWYPDSSTVTKSQFQIWALDSGGSVISTTLSWLAIGI